MSNVTLFNSANVPAFARQAELSETTKALLGGSGVDTKRISIKGGVFRLVVGGKEVSAIEDRHLDVVIVKAAPKVARVFYAATYDSNNVAAPDCWSNDGDKPDAKVKSKQSATCAQCPQNIAGSGQGQSRACRYQQRMAVVLADDVGGDVMQLSLPATSLFGKEVGDKRPLQAYARYLAAQTPPVNLDTIVTRMKFDTTSESPKLFFSPVRWLSEDEYATVQDQAASKDAEQAVTMTVAQVDGVAAPAPMTLEGKRPTAAVQEAPAEEEEEEEAPKPKATRTRRAAAPAPVADEGDEPEVRKAEVKPTAVPAKGNKLADIVSDWDD